MAASPPGCVPPRPARSAARCRDPGKRRSRADSPPVRGLIVGVPRSPEDSGSAAAWAVRRGTEKFLKGAMVRHAFLRDRLFLVDRQPRWNGLTRRQQLPIAKLCHLAKRTCEVAVVEHQHVRQPFNGATEVLHRSREARCELLSGNVMPTLHHAHGDALFRDLRVVEADEDHDHRIAPRRSSPEKVDLVAHWVGEDGFEDEALALLDQLLAHPVRELHRLECIDGKPTRKVVCVQETQARRREMRVVEGRLAGAVRPREGNDDGTRVERRHHFAGLNSRFTNRPTVRVPSWSILTTSPRLPGDSSKCGNGSLSRWRARRFRPGAVSIDDSSADRGRASPSRLSFIASGTRRYSSMA